MDRRIRDESGGDKVDAARPSVQGREAVPNRPDEL